MLTEGGGVEVAPGAMTRAGNEQPAIAGGQREVADEGVAPDGVVGEEAAEPAAGSGEARQVDAVQMLGHLRPDVRLIPAASHQQHTSLQISNLEVESKSKFRCSTNRGTSR